MNSDAVINAVTSVTKKWTKQRKAEIRGKSAATRRRRQSGDRVDRQGNDRPGQRPAQRPSVARRSRGVACGRQERTPERPKFRDATESFPTEGHRRTIPGRKRSKEHQSLAREGVKVMVGLIGLVGLISTPLACAHAPARRQDGLVPLVPLVPPKTVQIGRSKSSPKEWVLQIQATWEIQPNPEGKAKY